MYTKGQKIEIEDVQFSGSGTVLEVNPDQTYRVRIIDIDTVEARDIVIPESSIKPVISQRDFKKNSYDGYDKRNFFEEAVEKFKQAGDVFVPAFGGIFNGGEDQKATSEMTITVEEWISSNPSVVHQSVEGSYSFDPITTGTIDVTEMASGEEKKLDIPAGVIPIFGVTGAGKTQLASYLTGILEADYLRFGEPEIPSIHSPSLLIRNIHEFLNHPTKKILIIDSFRPFFYMTTSKASIGKGGINNALYMDFTALSSIATWAGKTILIVINPLATSKDDIETTKGNLESSTMGLIHVTSYGKFSFVARTQENKREVELYSVNMTKLSKKQKVADKTTSSVELEGMDVSDDLVYEANAWSKIFSGIQKQIK